MLTFDEVNSKFWDTEATIFIPCAASRLITQNQLERMSKSGVEVIAAGANVPFADAEIFFGPIAEEADKTLTYIPDFISNCGMARVFAYLMSSTLETIDDNAIFDDTSKTIFDALKAIHKKKIQHEKTLPTPLLKSH